jgi:hypothetical protein
VLTAASEPVSLSKAEAMFRAMAFRIVYNGVFADIADLTARFGCAIAYSSKEMSDRTLFQTWWTWTRGRSMKGLLESGQVPPVVLRPFVDAYLRAIGERARETGDDVADLM